MINAWIYDSLSIFFGKIGSGCYFFQVGFVLWALTEPLNLKMMDLKEGEVDLYYGRVIP